MQLCYKFVTGVYDNIENILHICSGKRVYIKQIYC